MPEIYKPGYLEAIFGPMKSGKSEYLIRMFNELRYSDIRGIVFKPAVNTREPGIASRGSDMQLEAIIVDEKHPEEILSYLNTFECKFVGVDEAQFFADNLVHVIEQLLKKEYHVIVCGLLLSFRGEPFGPMPSLVGRAHHVTRLTAICEYPNCNHWAVLTQRLINGKPCPYNSPLVLIENTGQSETYEPRCVNHHQVPREPQA
ncbi:MAG: thymidine kinase [Candidatus Hodarchaeales archaeon]|jgi:thymidine kinase